MRILEANVHLLSLALVEPFVSAREIVTGRDLSILELSAEIDGQRVTGWGECVALPQAGYTAEYRDGAATRIAYELVPLLTGEIHPDDVADRLASVPGNPMAKAAVEMAVLDAHLRAVGQSLAEYAGSSRDRVPAGVAIGLQDTPAAAAAAAHGYIAQGYGRVKLKIAPGRDVDVVAEVRDAIGAEVDLQVDANEAYRLDDRAHLEALEQLDEFGLTLIEQPLRRDDLRGHAELAERLQTPICLDESIDGFDAAARAVELGAADVLCVKPGAVGGYLSAMRIHDLAHHLGIPLWCGGMLESGFARSANLALAALPGFTLTGDLSATDRYFATDVVAPIVLDGDGMITVPSSPGCGPAPTGLAELTTATITVAT